MAERVGPLTALSSAALAAAGPRMRGLVDRRQMLEVQVSIDLSGADIGVAEQFLHSPQVTAGLEQVSGEGVAEHMRMHVHSNALTAAPGGDAQLHGTGRQRTAALPQEEHVGSSFDPLRPFS